MANREYHYAIGRRKESTAVVKLFPKGAGDLAILFGEDKKSSIEEYFGGNTHMLEAALKVFEVLGEQYRKMFDAEIKVAGGGSAGQADAIKLGIARAIILWNPELRLTLKPYGLLKRDPRVKERKKPGLKKARKAPTRSKR